MGWAPEDWPQGMGPKRGRGGVRWAQAAGGGLRGWGQVVGGSQFGSPRGRVGGLVWAPRIGHQKDGPQVVAPKRVGP